MTDQIVESHFDDDGTLHVEAAPRMDPAGGEGVVQMFAKRDDDGVVLRTQARDLAGVAGHLDYPFSNDEWDAFSGEIDAAYDPPALVESIVGLGDGIAATSDFLQPLISACEEAGDEPLAQALNLRMFALGEVGKTVRKITEGDEDGRQWEPLQTLIERAVEHLDDDDDEPEPALV